MSLRTYITDPATKRTASVTDGAGEQHALIVATRQLKTFKNTIKFFTNDDYGADMNKNGGFGGTPVKVHDGTDSVLWTATDIVGGAKTTFDSTDQNHTAAGTKSVKVDNPIVNDVYQFDKGSDLDCNGYVALTMWIYVDKDWANGDSISVYGWDTGTNLQIGTSVSLENYFDWGTFDIWQKIVIPLTDMGALAISTTLDALRITQSAVDGKAPKYYLDDIQFEETGTPIKFTVTPDKETWFHVKEFTISMADNIAGTLADATMPYLSYDKFLGAVLISGLNYQRMQNGKLLFTQNVKNLMEFMQLPGTSITGQGSDGTNTWLTLKSEHMEPLLLKPENDDELSFTVSDDLSVLLHLRISAGGKTEYRPTSGLKHELV